MTQDPIWLCLSGGNALGAFHAGAYQQLAEAGIEPQRIAGASIGALIGALIAGNAPEARVGKLEAFFALAEQWSILPETKSAKLAAGLQTLMGGRPGLFHPRLPASMLTWPLAGWPFLPSPRPSLFDTGPMREKLAELIDFEQLNSGPIRLLMTAVDVEDGTLHVFDSARDRLTIDHVMATTAFPVFFPPVVIGERSFVDPGLVENLPLEALFDAEPGVAATCLVLDTACPRGAVPDGLDAALSRAQDILFSAQSRQSLERVKRKQGDSRILMRAYCPEGGREASLKMIDFRRDSIRERWSAGRQAMALMLEEADLAANQAGAGLPEPA